MVRCDHKDFPQYGALVTSILASVLNTIAFCSFSWIESLPEFHSQFDRVGLWAACFNGYVHPEDYVSKAYYGCWSIYWPEYKYIREWLTPPWFISVQLACCISVSCNFICAILNLMQFSRALHKEEITQYIPAEPKTVKKASEYTEVALIFIEFLGTFLIAYSVVWFGVMSKDRNWLPRPDQNRVGYSFALEVLAGLFSAYAFIFFCIRYCMDHMRGPSEDDIETAEIQPLMAGKQPTMVSAADAAERHRERLEQQQQQGSSSRPPFAKSGSLHSLASPRMAPAASSSHMAAPPVFSPKSSQPYLGPSLIDSSV